VSQRELSIAAAAEEAPDAPALVLRDRELSFAEVAAAALTPPGAAADGEIRSPERAPQRDAGGATRARPLLAERAVETLLQIYGALERGEPLGLLHPQQPPSRRELIVDALARHPVPSDTAVVLFTSGSTGAPRGVVLPRRALLAAARAHAAHLPWRRDDGWLVALSLGHAGGLAAVVRCLVARRPVVLLEERAALWPLADALAHPRVTLTSLVPTQLAGLLDDARWRPAAALRAVLVGGAACPPSLRRRAAARGLPLLATYGMTETFGQVATARPPPPLPPTRAAAAVGAAEPAVAATTTDAPPADDDAIGPGLPGVTLRAGTAADPGPIEIAGDVCMTGYLGEPPLPAPRLIAEDDGWIDARGDLHVVGRRGDLINTGGYKVGPLLLEEELRLTPGVRDACAFAVPDARWGQVIGVALTVAPTFELAAAAAYWAAALPAAYRPRALIVVEQLPVGATGKVDRRAAAQLAPRVAVPYPLTSSRS
jgi:o-succinylbenzoate---CoA ligase